MTISFEQQRQDIESANRATTGRLFTGFRIYIYVFLGLCILAMFLSRLVHSGADLQTMGPQLKPVLILLFFFVILFWVSPRLAARKFVLRNVRWYLDDSGIKLQNDVASSELRWEAFQRYAETRHEFLLYVQKNQAHFIPKRVLSEAEQAELRDLLARHIKK